MDNSPSTLVHIHAPAPIQRFITCQRCPDCKKLSRFLSWLYEWYGADSTCLRCGREWNDREWMPLPFCRGARSKNIEAAKLKWRREKTPAASIQEEAAT